MTANHRAVITIIGRVIPYFVAEHGNIQAVVEQLLRHFQVEIHTERDRSLAVVGICISSHQPSKIGVLDVGGLPIMHASVGAHILIGRVTQSLALRRREP